MEIETSGLFFDYGKNQILRGIDLKIRKGEKVGIIGRNGSGKTTLIKHFNGLLKPTKGRVLINGKDTGEVHKRELVKDVGIVFQNPDSMLFENTVKQEVSFGPRNLGFGKEKIRKNSREALQLTGINRYESRDPYKLSFGEKKRVSIASVLTMESSILVLDEPLVGLDSYGLQEFRKIMGRLKKTYVIVTHAPEEVSDLLDRVILLENGKVVKDGSPAKVIKSAEELWCSGT
jgi:energy-coupling factor transporter ATP-binding protein EcfA2